MKTEEIDLARVGLAERNTLVMRRFDALKAGDCLELHTDAPPWVLYHQLRTERLGELEWKIVSQAGGEFVVRVTKLSPSVDKVREKVR